MIIRWLIAPVRKGEQPPWIVSDGLWARIEPLLPVVPRRADHPGRKRLDDRKVLCGILFVLYTGIPWEFLPQELGSGSGMTCWRRLRDWHQAGDRPPQHRAWVWPGRAPLGGGTVHRAAALVPPPAYPLGNPRRHPPGLPQPRLRRHLLAPTGQHATLLGVLIARRSQSVGIASVSYPNRPFWTPDGAGRA